MDTMGGRKPSDHETCRAAVRAEVTRVLAVDRIDSSHDDLTLFDLGLDSLMAVELAAQLRDRFGVPIDMVTLFEADTISALATLVQASGRF